VAFADDAAVRTIYPCDLAYRRHFPGFLTAFGGRAFDAGVVDIDRAGRGAALWFPPGLTPDDAAIKAHLEATVPPERLATIAPGMEAQGRLHPSVPHWYLPWIGVRPDARGTGVGSALLERGLARADADGMPAYLEATSERNAALYLRHGFEVLSIMATPGYPELIAMWRPARGSQRSPVVVDPPVPEPDPVRRPGLLARLVDGFRDRRLRARTYRELLALDDRLLQDIGLTYGDIVAAMAARQHVRRTPPSW
jgi:uncharacterized protein YjiS (DUF1127 family)/GNAT superfamily N-acetyltransferase